MKIVVVVSVREHTCDRYAVNTERLSFRGGIVHERSKKKRKQYVVFIKQYLYIIEKPAGIFRRRPALKASRSSTITRGKMKHINNYQRYAIIIRRDATGDFVVRFMLNQCNQKLRRKLSQIKRKAVRAQRKTHQYRRPSLYSF